MEESSAGKGGHKGNDSSTETTHIRVRENKLENVKTSQGSEVQAKRAF